LSYIDQGKADEAREQGNALFKAADYPGAVKAYTEAVKRAPEDPRGYANRAAAYIKLASFPDAIKVKLPSNSYDVVLVYADARLCRIATKQSPSTPTS
jgi:tetratricopeptide (TPR) repeat protein